MKALKFIFHYSLITCLLSCVVTSYTRTEEREITGNLANLILGQFAHHGKAFYAKEEEKNKRILEERPHDFMARNDLAVAQLKQAKWQDALQNLEQNESFAPNRYETAINMGILYKKQGNFSKSVDYIKKSLEIKPKGHMGLDDYYLKMVQWKELVQSIQKNKKSEKLYTGVSVNFLKTPYAKGSVETVKGANKAHVITLIKNDFMFPDAYLVLGDILFEEKNMQLAMRAYYRAKMLDHPNPEILNNRIQNIYSYWRKNKQQGYIIDRLRGSRQLNKELESAELWLENFKHIETNLIKSGQAASFKDTHKKMIKIGNKRPRIIDAIYYKGYKNKNFFEYVALGVMLAILIGILLFIRFLLQRFEFMKA